MIVDKQISILWGKSAIYKCLDLKVYFSSARSFEKVGPAKIILQNQGVSKTNFVLIFAYDEMENGLAIIF